MKRLLIANRSEIARRIIRTAHAMGIETVAVYSDADAQALHVKDAGQAVALNGNASADTYLRIDKLIAAAAASGADAIHPGYGFLSENADFAQAVLDAGLIWVGPPPPAIRALGSKSAARELAQGLGMPCLPGYQGEDQTDARFAAEALRLGFPLMVKATAGGGGRGMRLVLAAEQLQAALDSARSEALNSFGSAELLMERALLSPCHVEVQVFADAHGHCIHLGERDCSVQRRHQKIIEESPSPAVDDALRQRMGECALQLVRGSGYQGAGTVEFLLDGRDFYLMEMNTRLQVEHPVTEMRAGIDLVEWQLRVARGEPLPLTQAQLQLNGHAIELRLCAEDEQFMPHAGRVQQFAEPPLARFDHALQAGHDVPPWYDSMLGKLIVHAATREAAIGQLQTALARTRVLGLPTNRALLSACLGDEVFAAGHALIPFLAERGDGLRAGLQTQERAVLLHAGLAMAFARCGAGSQLPGPFARALRWRLRGEVQALSVRELGRGELQVTRGGQTHQARLTRGADGSTEVEVDGLRHRVHAAPCGERRWHVQVGAVELWLQDASFEPAPRAGQISGAAELRAPFNGKVIAVLTEAGRSVRRGDTLVTLESMKLEHALAAPRDGVVQALNVQTGQQVGSGQILLSMTP
jgi:3-methylcrotonyl-CoA carboxylase alpha subunit/geranyl-CoA carboxylase alpha subunit